MTGRPGGVPGTRVPFGEMQAGKQGVGRGKTGDSTPGKPQSGMYVAASCLPADGPFYPRAGLFPVLPNRCPYRAGANGTNNG